jgi:hypothetical protein
LAEEVADDLIAWVEETDIDGFNLSRIVTPESLEDFVDLVVPILQERGAYKRDYMPGTLREKLFGRSQPFFRSFRPSSGSPCRRAPRSPRVEPRATVGAVRRSMPNAKKLAQDDAGDHGGKGGRTAAASAASAKCSCKMRK